MSLPSRVSLLLLTAALILAIPQPAAGDSPAKPADVSHPFMLWTKDDFATLAKRLDAEPYKSIYADMKQSRHNGVKSLANLIAWGALGNEEAAEKEKKHFLSVIRSPAPRGGAQWINVLRYDVLYDRLTENQRREYRDFAETYIKHGIYDNAVLDPNVFNDSRNYSRYDARRYSRTNWLPNIIWPRKVSGNLIATSLREGDRIRRAWGAYGSWQYYFDDYLCDVGFYSEEFSKMGSTPGAMLVNCLALDRLGLGKLGFGYEGDLSNGRRVTRGPTMRGHIESLIHLGYPRVDIGSQRPHYPMVTMGDLRQGGSSQKGDFRAPGLQHSIVVGYLPNGNGGNTRWNAPGAWGGEKRGNHPQWDGYSQFTPKMQLPLWFELGHKRWPESGFGYFLAQMRRPGDDAYAPSLMWGVEPVAPGEVNPPAAPSAIWPERGIVMLRHLETSDYWESPEPAVAMRLATGYAHHVNDSFALLGYYALNRPIYVNRQVTPGYAKDWSRSIQSHCGVTVDAAEPEFTDETLTRKVFTAPVKISLASSDEVYPGVQLTRALLLTGEYLLDVTRLAGEKEHRYDWLVHALGEATCDDASAWKQAELPDGLEKLANVRKYRAGEDGWQLTALQTCALDDPSEATLPESWYARKVGVRVQMLGAEGLDVYTARTPLPVEKYRDADGKRKQRQRPSETGGVTIIASRKARDATFAALHQPFEKGTFPEMTFRRWASGEDGALGVSVVSEKAGVNDLAFVQLSPTARAVTLTRGHESVTFTGQAWIRRSREAVEVIGGVTALKLTVQGNPAVRVGGAAVKATIRDGVATWSAE